MVTDVGHEFKQLHSYQGNINLKKAGTSLQFSPEEIEELLRCQEDPQYFIEKYVKIVHVDRGIINFIPYPYQVKMANAIKNDRFTIFKLPRQSGKTTIVVGMMLWYALFNETFSIAILANKGDQAQEILARIKVAYEWLPWFLQQGIMKWNERSIALENGAVIFTSATSGDAIRGRSMNLVYLDEFAHIHSNMQEKFFTSVYPTISSGTSTKVIVTSTPNGLNYFYKIWMDAINKRNSYTPIDVHWSETPGRDEAWKQETIKNTSEEQFAQEYETEFIGSSNTLILPRVLHKLAFIEPLIKRDNDMLKFYSHPSPGRTYITVVDTSRGGGGDYSAFIVFDVTQTPFTIACTYRNNLINALLYPNVIFEAARHYNNSEVLIETNDIGEQVANMLYLDLEYEHVLSTHLNGKTGQTLGFGTHTNTRRGVKTSTPVKKTGCVMLKSLIENDKLRVEDEQIINELYRFVQKGSSFEAENGSDDLVMCCVLFAWLVNQPLFKDLTNSDVRSTIYKENRNQLEQTLTPIGMKVFGDESIVIPGEIKTVGSLEAWFHNDN